MIPARRTVTAAYECLISRRGLYEFGPSRLSTSAPLGLLACQRVMSDRQRLFVVPARLPLRRHWRRRLRARPGGDFASMRRGDAQEGDFFGIRQWRHGDSSRWVHWRTTARIGELAVRQFEQNRRFELCVLVDAYLPQLDHAARGEAARAGLGAETNHLAAEVPQSPEQMLERVISVAASLVTEVIATPANKLGLVVAGRRTAALTNGGSREQTVAMLRQLTLLAGDAQPDLDEAIRLMLHTLGRPRDLLVLSPRPLVGEAGKLFRSICRGSSWRWLSAADGSLDQLVRPGRRGRVGMPEQADRDGSDQPVQRTLLRGGEQ